MKKINSYKNGILHEWMTARISFALTLPLCKSHAEKLEVLDEHESDFLDNIFTLYGSDAEKYAKKLIIKHPFYSNWKELEKASSDMGTRYILVSRAVWEHIRSRMVALHHAGLCNAEPSQCGNSTALTVTACAQVMRKIGRIIDDAQEYINLTEKES